MGYQVSLNIVRQFPPRRREREKNAVASGVARIAMRAVKQSVIDHYSIARSQAECHLVREVAQSDMSRLKSFRTVPVRLGKDGVDRCALEMRTPEDPQSTVLGICVRQITKNSYLWGHSPIAQRMIPAPPILMPPQGRAMRFLDAHVSGNPFKIVRT